MPIETPQPREKTGGIGAATPFPQPTAWSFDQVFLGEIGHRSGSIRGDIGCSPDILGTFRPPVAQHLIQRIESRPPRHQRLATHMNFPAREPTIVIVEDDEGHAILIDENLADAGLAPCIHHFRDGQAVLDYFFGSRGPIAAQVEHSFLVLLDIHMPKVNGIEVLRRLKLDQQFKKMPVVMLTTSDDLGDIERCYELGCSAYIRKPIDYDQFTEVVRRLALFSRLLLVPSVVVG
jgi:CheY-like chemotaxis protein